MSDKLGAVAYDERADTGRYLGMTGFHEKKYSEETAKAIDDEVKKILNEAHAAAKKIILDHKEEVELMATMLMEFETLDSDDIQKIVNHQWDPEEKRAKLKKASELNKKAPVNPPPSPFESKQPGTSAPKPLTSQAGG